MAAAARRWPRRLLRWSLAVVVGWFVWQAMVLLVGAADWTAVGSAFRGLPAWGFVPIVVLLLARQVLNAVPLTFYVPGLGLLRSAQNDAVANLAGTFAPPPGDVVLRIAMFRSWDLDPVAGMTGVTLNMAKFYVIRFVAPVLGLLALGIHEAERRHWVVAALCALASAAFLGGLALLLRSDGLAARLGRTAGSVAHRFRRSVDPAAWAAYLVDLRGRTADSLRRGLWPSMLALVGMLAVDATILLVALRAVGVPSRSLPPADVYAAYLLAYPLTLLPLFGLGVLDAVVVGSLTTVAGAAHEPGVVAGTLVWRIVTLLGPLALGLLCLAWWRLRRPSPRPLPTSPVPVPAPHPPGRTT